MHQEISGLFIHHLVAKLKEDVICLTFPPSRRHDKSDSPTWLSLVFPSQAILHAEEEGTSHVRDCQPLRLPHRVEPGRPHPEGQTAEEPAV